MIYIVVLNWNNSEDTISCIKSLSFLIRVEFKIIICDNASTDNSCLNLITWFSSEGGEYFNSDLLVIDEKDNLYFNTEEVSESVFLIKNEKNLGYSGGNNIGIRFALNQTDMKYVWVLNNDTEVEPDALYWLLKKSSSDSSIGICGSKLIYSYDRSKVQGFGGCYNSWICTTKNYKWLESSSTNYYDEEIEKNIDYVIGASMFISRDLLEKVGLLCEDYFLYYEEIDICLRAKKYFNLGVSTNSIVYHKEGASTDSGKSMIADYCSVKNRLLVTKKFYPFKLPFVWFSLFFVLFNRVRRREYKKAKVVARIILLGK